MHLQRIILFLCLVPCLCTTLAQTTHSTLFGVGAVRQLDTYLSPLNYKGPQVQFMKEKLRPTQLWKGRVAYQGIMQIDIASTRNATKKSTSLSGDISYSATWYYTFFNHLPFNMFSSSAKFILMAGPQLGGSLGILYNTRNGNNPAQALASANLGISGAAICSFSLCGHTFSLREQLDIPCLGLMFSPNYDQSYFDIFSEGHYNHNVCFTSPVNAPCCRNLLTLDFPLAGATIRAGYLIDIRQSNVNQIKHHSYTHAFMIGWVKYLYHRPRREALKDNFIL